MKTVSKLGAFRALAIGCLAVLSGCGGGGSSTGVSAGAAAVPIAAAPGVATPPPSPTPVDPGTAATPTPAASVKATIGPQGGTVTGPDGVQVFLPVGALDRPTEIGIARVAAASAGVPASSAAYPTGEFVYELTPHDVQFNLPATITAAVGSAPGTQIFMASPGEDWSAKAATVANGVASWERSSFSWMFPGACYVPTSMTSDPHWCVYASTLARVSATPPEALVRTAASDSRLGDAGVFSLTRAATVTFTHNVSVPSNCGNVSVKLYQSKFDETRLVWPTRSELLLTTVSMVSGPRTALGTATFSQALDHTNNGKNRYSLVASYECPTITHAPDGRGGTTYSWNYAARHVSRLGDAMVINTSIPAPTTFYTVGGTATGLTGAGLSLQLNGASSLRVAADGAFNFAGTLGAGTPYAVTVVAQPTGQTCTVANASGVLTAAVSNVAVTCTTTPVAGTKYPVTVFIDFTATSAVTLQNNGGDTFSGEGDASFEFPTYLPVGAPYNVTVLTPPVGQTCTVRNGVGIMNLTDRPNVGVYCVSPGVPVFVTNPKSLYAVVGQTPTFTVDVTGAMPMRLQWTKSAPETGTSSDLISETERSVTLLPVTLADNEFRYFVTANNGAGDATSDRAVLRVCQSGPVAVPGTPPSTLGQFCPRTVTRSLPNAAGLVTLTWTEVIYAVTSIYFEALSVVVHPTTGALDSVVYQVNDPTNTLSWLCTAAPVAGRPTCAGVSVSVAAGTLRFSDTVVGNGTDVTLNGALKF